MTTQFKEHIIAAGTEARKVLQVLGDLPDLNSRNVFIIDADGAMVGSVTDGDIRRGLLRGLEISMPIDAFMNTQFRYLQTEQVDYAEKIREYRKNGIALVPILDTNKVLTKIIDVSQLKTWLPVTALLLAGGKGERLRPLTENTPKPLLKIGDKPIIEINIDRLIAAGVSEFYISVQYLAHQIESYLGDGSSKGVSIKYIHETEPLGTVGSLKLIETNAKHQEFLVMNADLLTTIDFGDFYESFLKANAPMMVASVPYHVRIPYGVLDIANNGETAAIIGLKEKPSFTYYSNAGIYFIKRHLQSWIPASISFNATDLMDLLIAKGENPQHFPVLQYWLDIGKYEDYLKAQMDIKFLHL